MNVEQLSEQLRRTAAAAPARGVDLDAVVTGAQRVRRRRRIAAAAAGLLIVAAGATTSALTLSDGRDSGSTIAPQPLPSRSSAPAPSVLPSSITPTPVVTPTEARTPTPSLQPPPGWSTAASFPLEGGAARAAVGGQLVYWAGRADTDTDTSGFGNAGASYDVASRSWSLIPSSPISGRNAAATAGSDRLFFVWGGTQTPETGQALIPDGATYDVVTRRWHVLPPAPIDRQPLGAAWDGQRFIVVSNGAVAAYDPALDRWQNLPALPAPSINVNNAVVQAGSRTYVIGSNSYFLERGAAAWSPVPPLRDSARAGPAGDANLNTLTSASDGTTLFAAALTFGGAPIVASYDPATASWTSLPRSPIRQAECAVPLAVTPTSVYVACATVGSYDRRTGTWLDFGDSRGWGATGPSNVGGNDPVAIGSSIVFVGDPTLVYSPP